MSDDISECALDIAVAESVTTKLQDFATTRAQETFLAAFLEDTSHRQVAPWQVGEAIAETVLEECHGVIFPWNTRRDERNPKANLPGADLVGISTESEVCRLIFGEVKSSSEQKSPPRVMRGKNGMLQQLERLIDDPSLQWSLIKWLDTRVWDITTEPLYLEALSAFVTTEGVSVRWVGVLVRDTNPNENDVPTRGKDLGNKVSAPGSVELHVLYMPRPMTEWTEWVNV